MTTLNLLNVLHNPLEHSVYIFGSHGDCSTIPHISPDMKSDIDIVEIPKYLHLVTKLADCQISDGFLLIPDRQPGYARLQAVTQGQPITIQTGMGIPWMMIHPEFILQRDNVNRLCLTQNWQSLAAGMHRQGPARNRPSTEYTLSADHVFGLECETWPECAREWLTRKREHGWPSAELIEKCKSLGFLVVQAEHPDSDESHLQWRISFSHQEMLLLKTLNSVQFKCFFLLKFFKKQFIQLFIKVEMLTTYHCKTCTLYCIENTPNELWVPENLAACLLMCLKQLLLWVYNENCPNYFIPGENMFDRMPRSNILRKQLLGIFNKYLFTSDGLMEDLLLCMFSRNLAVRKIIESAQVLNADLEITSNQLTLSNTAVLKQYRTCCFKSLYMADTVCDVMFSRARIISHCVDNRLEHFTGKLQTTVMEREIARRVKEYTEEQSIEAVPVVISRCFDSRLEHFTDIDKLQNMVSELEQTRRVAGFTEEQSRETISLLLPFLQLSLLSLKVVNVIEQGPEQLQEILNDEKWNELDVQTGSSKLKQVCAMLMLGYTDTSLDILSSVIHNGIHKKLPLCQCYNNLPGPYTCIILGVPFQRRYALIKKLFVEFYQPCVIFYRMSIGLLPWL